MRACSLTCSRPREGRLQEVQTWQDRGCTDVKDMHASLLTVGATRTAATTEPQPLSGCVDVVVATGTGVGTEGCV